jgi:hypothetical protein
LRKNDQKLMEIDTGKMRIFWNLIRWQLW